MSRRILKATALLFSFQVGSTLTCAAYPFWFPPKLGHAPQDSHLSPVDISKRPSSKDLTAKEKLYIRHLLLAYAGRGNSVILANAFDDSVEYENAFLSVQGKIPVVRVLKNLCVFRPTPLGHSEAGQDTENGRHVNVILTQQMLDPVFKSQTIVPLSIDVDVDEDEKIFRLDERIYARQGLELPYFMKRINGFVLESCLRLSGAC